MKTTSLIFVLAMVVLLFGCGKEAEEAKEAMELLSDMPEKVEKVQDAMDKAEKRKALRKKKGDTVAVPYKKLQEYLPVSIDGFGDAKLSGEQMKMGLFSMSQAKAKYEKMNEDGSKTVIDINIADYVENYGYYMGMAAWMGGYEREDDNGWEKTFDPGVENVWAFEKYNKPREKAELTYAIAWRFIINIEARKIGSPDLLRDIASKIDMASLSKM